MCLFLKWKYGYTLIDYSDVSRNSPLRGLARVGIMNTQIWVHRSLFLRLLSSPASWSVIIHIFKNYRAGGRVFWFVSQNIDACMGMFCVRIKTEEKILISFLWIICKCLCLKEMEGAGEKQWMFPSKFQFYNTKYFISICFVSKQFLMYTDKFSKKQIRFLKSDKISKNQIQGWIYPVSHRSLGCKIEVIRCELDCASQKIAMQSDLDRAKKMLFVCDFRACMNACTWGLCSSVRSKIFACTRFHFTFRATFRVCHTHVVSLIFVCAVLIPSCNLRLTEWDVGSSKYFLTSQLGRWSRCREKRRLDFEKCSTWSVALIFANCAGELFIASWIAEYSYMKGFCWW